MHKGKKLFPKKHIPNIPPLPPRETIIEQMHNKQLNFFPDTIMNVFYSKDKSMRYVILQNHNGYFTYHLETLYRYDEEEWQYFCCKNNALPAIWEPCKTIKKSIFSNETDLIKEMKTEPEYKQYFK